VQAAESESFPRARNEYPAAGADMSAPRIPPARERNSQVNGNGECVTGTQWLTTHLAFGAVRTVAMLDLRLPADKTKESVHWTEMSADLDHGLAKPCQ